MAAHPKNENESAIATAERLLRMKKYNESDIIKTWYDVESPNNRSNPGYVERALNRIEALVNENESFEKQLAEMSEIYGLSIDTSTEVATYKA